MGSRKGKAFSFEFFPPKGEQGVTRLSETVRLLAPLRPHYVSVTFGAGGTHAATVPTRLRATSSRPPASRSFPTSRAWG